jgi:hypothetical protein
MRSNIVLIDNENLRPDSLQLLEPEHFRVFLFIGENQSKLPRETVLPMQKLGARAEYVEIDGNGRNALDFHIAYYLGVHALRDPSAYFHIVSHDTGFDPLIKHLKATSASAARTQPNPVAPARSIRTASTAQQTNPNTASTSRRFSAL